MSVFLKPIPFPIEMTKSWDDYDTTLISLLSPVICDTRPSVLECLFNDQNYRPGLFDVIHTLSTPLFVKTCVNYYQYRINNRRFLRLLLDKHFNLLVDQYLSKAENGEDEVFTEMIRKLFILGFKTGEHRETVKEALEKFTKGLALTPALI